MFYGLTAFFYSTQVLPHWQKCDGSLIPEQYSAARSALGNHTPDLRERFIRVRDSQNIGLTQEDSVKSHTHEYRGYSSMSGGAFKVSRGSSTSTYVGMDTQPFGDTETRPKSVYLNLCIYLKEGYPMEDKIDQILEICQKFDKSYEANEDEFHLSDELLNLCQTWYWTGQSRGG